jgi:hypothetical protein
MWQHRYQKLAFGKFKEVLKFEMAFALFDLLDIVAALAAGQQPAQSSIGSAIARINQNVRCAIDEDKA